MAERMNTNCAIHQIVVFGLSDRGLQREGIRFRRDTLLPQGLAART